MSKGGYKIFDQGVVQETIIMANNAGFKNGIFILIHDVYKSLVVN
jgi:hypothetical protein